MSDTTAMRELAEDWARPEGEVRNALEESADEIDRLRAACAALESALSRIDYALGPPNDKGVSPYDVDRDDERVVRAVVAAIRARG